MPQHLFARNEQDANDDNIQWTSEQIAIALDILQAHLFLTGQGQCARQAGVVVEPSLDCDTGYKENNAKQLKQQNPVQCLVPPFERFSAFSLVKNCFATHPSPLTSPPGSRYRIPDWCACVCVYIGGGYTDEDENQNQKNFNKNCILSFSNEPRFFFVAANCQRLDLVRVFFVNVLQNFSLLYDSFCLPNNGWRTISAHGTVIAIICYIYLLCTPTHTHISITPIASRGECKKSRKKKANNNNPYRSVSHFRQSYFPLFLLLLHRCSAIFFFSQHPIRAPIESLKTINQAKPFIPVYCASSNPLAFGATVEHLDLSVPPRSMEHSASYPGKERYKYTHAAVQQARLIDARNKGALRL